MVAGSSLAEKRVTFVSKLPKSCAFLLSALFWGCYPSSCRSGRTGKLLTGCTMKICCCTTLRDLADRIERLAEKDEYHGRNGDAPFAPDFWYQEAASLRALALELRELAEHTAAANGHPLREPRAAAGDVSTHM